MRFTIGLVVLPIRAVTFHDLESRISIRMDVRLAHAVLIVFHRFQRDSKSARARFRIVSLIVLGSSF